MNDYRPKHMAWSGPSYLLHECKGGCMPMGCEGGCCVFDAVHRTSCPAYALNQYNNAMHDNYVARGLRRHLQKEIQ